MADAQYAQYKIYHYASVDYAKQANAACLMGCFMIINLKKTAEEAWKVFAPYHNKFVPYRDATWAHVLINARFWTASEAWSTR